MGKVIKFPGSDGNNKENERKNFEKIDFSTQQILKDAIEEYLLNNFAVKNVLGMDIVYKMNDSGEFGAIGVVIYEHKRRGGTFQADFITKGLFDKKNKTASIYELAFSAGEPDLYRSIYNYLKAKKLLPPVTG